MEKNHIINAINYDVLFGQSVDILNEFVNNRDYSRIFILVDENTQRDCLSKIQDNLTFKYATFLITSGEEHKNIQTATSIWNAMANNGLDRHSLMINLGGGVIGDMGGFCASTYMRGIDFIQVPTTLLAQVDASVGGKLAIDMNAFKNIVGLFNNPQLVIIDDQFLDTLSKREQKSGFGELLKHGLIKSKALFDQLIDLDSFENIVWKDWIYNSVLIKNEIVLEDPFEKGIRKILNFGHTIGHAIESELLDTDEKLLHGEAIIIGMIMESKLSVIKGWLSQSDCDFLSAELLKFYPSLIKKLPPFDLLWKRMLLDKKNKNGVVNFTLLKGIGNAIYNQSANQEEIKESIDYYTNCTL